MKRRCRRKGHRMRNVTRRGYAWPPKIGDMAIAHEVTQTRAECERCGYSEQDWTEVSRRPLQGLTMDTPRWDRLRETGWLPR